MTQSKVKTTNSAGGIVFNELSEVILVEQDGVSWSFPKGHLEELEDDLAAAEREISEETGLNQVELVGELGSYVRYKIGQFGQGEDRSELKKISMFLFFSKKLPLSQSDRAVTQAIWLSLAEAKNRLTHEKDREFLIKVESVMNDRINQFLKSK